LKINIFYIEKIFKKKNVKNVEKIPISEQSANPFFSVGGNWIHEKVEITNEKIFIIFAFPQLILQFFDPSLQE
jgi:hypothetical protein